MDLNTLVRQVKRKTGYGTVGRNTDQATRDIIDFVNSRAKEMYEWHEWLFSLREVTINTVANQKDYTLEAEDGDILILFPRDSSKVDDSIGANPLEKWTFKRYYGWYYDAEANGTDTGRTIGYLDIGRDDEDRQQIRLIRTPDTSDDVISGWVRQRLTDYVVGDISTNERLAYFPKEMHWVLRNGVISDVLDIQGKEAKAQVWDQKFKAEMKRKKGQQEGKPSKSITTSLPPMYRRRQRRRGGTTVA